MSHPPRYPWNGFSTVSIHASESAVKQHPMYPASKSGDPDAASLLVNELVSSKITQDLTALIGKPRSVKIGLEIETLPRLRDKHGQDLENW